MKKFFFGFWEQANQRISQSFLGKRTCDCFSYYRSDFLKGLVDIIILCSLLSLAACESSSDENLSEWMAMVRRDARTSPVSLPEPLAVIPSVYESAGRVDPFDPSKISTLLDISDHPGIRPNLKRSREPLESYPLDQFRMVGSLGRPGQSVALVEVGKILYQLRKGNHLGQDLGEVIHIMDGSIEIEETIQEANGNWIKRRVQLSMREAK
jgi:type IV pilus assembly protein PilP